MSSNPITGGHLRRELAFRITCPQDGRPAECRVVQDVRTGQWKQVIHCSLVDLDERDCGVECARLANLGLTATPTPLG